jgi:hypothetical protein
MSREEEKESEFTINCQRNEPINPGSGNAKPNNIQLEPLRHALCPYRLLCSIVAIYRLSTKAHH